MSLRSLRKELESKSHKQKALIISHIFSSFSDEKMFFLIKLCPQAKNYAKKDAAICIWENVVKYDSVN